MIMVEKPLRNFFISLSQSKVLNAAAKKWGLQFGASQVVAGQTIPAAIKQVKRLNELGLVCTMDHLGEFVETREEAKEAAQYCIKTIEAIAESGVNSNLSLKLTQLGLDIDPQFCLENMRQIVETAKRHNNFVRIDMEDNSRCQATLDILKKLREDYDNVGTVIQAYLYRSEQDVEELQGVSLRLVKGAYKEAAQVAFQDKEMIDENYMKIISNHLKSGNYTAIATHDHHIIDKVKKLTETHQIPREQFEFQMLYGFRKDLQLQLVKEGYLVRVYVPFGVDWFGYFMRRLAERPQNVAFALRSILSK
jgi:proline dehydrogenase